MKKKLFLNTTDISEITGYSMRNSRNIIKYIKRELDLPDFQSVSIFDFCFVFNMPVNTVYRYINDKDFQILPVDEEAFRRQQSYERFDPKNKMKYLHSIHFEYLTHKKRTKKEDLDGDLESHSIDTGS